MSLPAASDAVQTGGTERGRCRRRRWSLRRTGRRRTRPRHGKGQAGREDAGEGQCATRVAVNAGPRRRPDWGRGCDTALMLWRNRRSMFASAVRRNPGRASPMTAGRIEAMTESNRPQMPAPEPGGVHASAMTANRPSCENATDLASSVRAGSRASRCAPSSSLPSQLPRTRARRSP
jgi:hypothetical protein